MIDSRSSIQEPSASAAIVACGTLGLSANRNSSRRLISGNRASISRRRSRRSARSCHLSLEQRGEVRDRGLLLAGRFGGHLLGTGRLTVGSFSSVACASISASNAASVRSARRSSCRLQARAAGHSPTGRLVGGGDSIAGRLVVDLAARPALGSRGAPGEHRDRAAVVRARGQARRGRRARTSAGRGSRQSSSTSTICRAAS